MYQIKVGSLCAGFNLIELKKKKKIDRLYGHSRTLRADAVSSLAQTCSLLDQWRAGQQDRTS